jgi:hypothetical protein
VRVPLEVIDCDHATKLTCNLVDHMFEVTKGYYDYALINASEGVVRRAMANC